MTMTMTRDMDKNYPGGGLEPPIFGLGDRRVILSWEQGNLP